MAIADRMHSRIAVHSPCYLLSPVIVQVVRQDPYELLGSGLQEVVSHEIGHCLGLRHNFKGSMGISALTALTGLTP